MSYYRAVCDYLRENGVDREPDMDTVQDDYDCGTDHETSAKEFIEAWS